MDQRVRDEYPCVVAIVCVPGRYEMSAVRKTINGQTEAWNRSCDRNEPGQVFKFLGEVVVSWGDMFRVVMEAENCLNDPLVNGFGGDIPVMFAPRDWYQAVINPVRTDKRDVERLARLTLAGAFDGEEVYFNEDGVFVEADTVEKKTYVAAWACDERGFLCVTYHPDPERTDKDQRAREFRALVRQEADSRRRFDTAKQRKESEAVLDMLRKQYMVANDAVQAVFERDESYRHAAIELHRVMGIDAQAARTLWAECNLMELRGKKAFYAWCGLVPSERLSGAPRVKKTGNHRVKSVMYAAADARWERERMVEKPSPQTRAKAARNVAKDVYRVLKDLKQE